MRPFILSFIAFLFTIVIGKGQVPYKRIDKIETKGREKRKHLPKTLIVKLTPEAVLLVKKFNQNIPAIRKSGVKVVSLEQMFPDAKKPQTLFNQNDQKLADLSRTYILRYSAKLSEESAAEELLKTGLAEYVEPYYLDEVFVIPNDPQADPDSSQFYLSHYQAYDAWEVTKGDSNVVIGIIDTGVRSYHEDLKDNLKYNVTEANGTHGVDDDNDGYIDNIAGWDFGNNDNNPDATGNGHGTFVAGCASATPDNSMGGTGTGFKCKYLPVKASPDSLGGTISMGYQGIYFAANQGCKVINLSWGGTGGYSELAQEIITYAAVNRDVAVIAAAGNSGLEEDYYPASYKYVLSVASSDTVYSSTQSAYIGTKSQYATYSYNVDLCAQGKGVFSTNNNGDYSREPGSSYAAPQVAGAAALVRSRFPDLKGIQVIEQLRVTGDIIDTFPENLQYKEKIGRRLNMYKALTDTLKPSVRMTEATLKTQFGNFAFSGDTVKVYLDFVNYLHPTTNCKVTISSPSPYIKFIDSISHLGIVPTLDSADNLNDPFIFYIEDITATDYIIPFRLQFEDTNYYDYQHFKHIVNPSWITIDTNETALTVTGSGRLGYIDNNNYFGDGFTYKNYSLMFEAGLMVALNDSTVSDCVRGEPLSVDSDFSTVHGVKFVNPLFSDVQTRSKITDTSLNKPVGVVIEQNTYAWNSTGDRKYVIVEYKIENVSDKTMDSLYLGIYSDWDIMNSGMNRANWDETRNLGYAYSTETNGLYAGISLLTNERPTYFALDHYNSGPENINPNDGFPSSEKFLTMKNGVSKTEAGVTGTGTDVSHVVGAKVYNLKKGEIRKIAFAILAGDDLPSLQNSADAANIKYRSFNTGPVPEVSDLVYCEGDTVAYSIKPLNGSIFNFYNNFPDNPDNLVFTGNEFNSQATETDTIYVSNTDSVFESLSVPVIISFTKKPEVGFSINPDTLNLAQQDFVEFMSTADPAHEHLWDFGDATQSTEVNPTHSYSESGNYQISLVITDTSGCTSNYIDTLIVKNEVVTNNLTFSSSDISIFPIPANELLMVRSQKDVLTELRIYNLFGVEVKSFEGVNKNLVHLNIKNLPSGVYIIHIKGQTGTVTKSILKQ